jgi:predicted transcriptional regulator
VVKEASRMADIRKSARAISQEAFSLQGHLVEVQQRMEDAVAEENGKEQSVLELVVEFPPLEVVDAPALDLVIEIQLVGGEPVVATVVDEKFEVSHS